jgi:succinate dehydrogenase/fumarate reductase flavoprotein subunit
VWAHECVVCVRVRVHARGARCRADEFGKKTFPNPTFTAASSGPFYLGLVTPTLHYCMGGLHIDNSAHVLSAGPGHAPIPGLYAAGEVVGGIHGNNRLAGNALTECVVFGRIAGATIRAEAQALAQAEVQAAAAPAPASVETAVGVTAAAAIAAASGGAPPAAAAAVAGISAAQLRANDGKDGRRLWAAIHGQVRECVIVSCLVCMCM